MVGSSTGDDAVRLLDGTAVAAEVVNEVGDIPSTGDCAGWSLTQWRDVNVEDGSGLTIEGRGGAGDFGDAWGVEGGSNFAIEFRAGTEESREISVKDVVNPEIWKLTVVANLAGVETDMRVADDIIPDDIRCAFNLRRLRINQTPIAVATSTTPPTTLPTIKSILVFLG